ncbi:MAG: SH3 domain-containing protein [Thermomicrobium sp.]|nr:SH3 domain-containing protein [Thermomicrobium sp.]MDW7982735.1 SH3 domain-containing protein [Thermomicrobium sp.]
MSFFRDEPPGRDPEPEEPTIPPFSSRPPSGTPFGSERSYTYQTDDRYWTDYLRIAAPVLGVILMLGLAWFWINQLLGGQEEAIPTVTVTHVITGPTPTPSGTPAGLIVITPAASNPTPTAIAGTPTPRTTIGPGATVVVANTDGAGVNLRAAPSTSADVLERLPEGTQLTVVGESISADGYVWWPVKYGNQDGYVVADYLELARP